MLIRKDMVIFVRIVMEQKVSNVVVSSLVIEIMLVARKSARVIKNLVKLRINIGNIFKIT